MERKLGKYIVGVVVVPLGAIRSTPRFVRKSSLEATHYSWRRYDECRGDALESKTWR